MKPILSDFLKKLIISALSLGVVILIIFTLLLSPSYLPVFIFLLVFVSGFTFFSFRWLVNTGNSDFGKFIRKIMVITVLRLFVYILLTVLYALFLNKSLLVFIIGFGIIYLVFTSLEVYELILGTGRPSPGQNKNN